MLSRINIFQIIRDHFKTLRSLNQKTKGIYWQDFILFILFPIALSGFATYKNYSLQNQVTNLIAATSIIGGFLFNLLAIIYGQIDKIKSDADTEQNYLKKVFVKEIHINISFGIVLSIILVLTLILYSIDFKGEQIFEVLNKALLAINYFLITEFTLTILMVVNRVYILLKKDSGV
jgi:hypothetical protein